MGEPGVIGLQPLQVEVGQYGQPEGIEANIAHALSLGLEELNIGLVRHDGTFVVVGSGPSVKHQLDAIRAEKEAGRPICAINGAHDFLLANDIVPSLFLTVDPRAMTGEEPRPEVNNFRLAHPDTVYCIASRCHPTTFNRLKGMKVLLWHCYGQEEENNFLKGKTLVGGGTTSGLRAITFAYIQGFRNFKLYGLDSCLGERKEKHVEGRVLPVNVETMDVHVGGREFLCNVAMAQQANEFQTLWDIMPDLHIRVCGGGLLSAIMDERKKQGFTV